MNWIVIVTVLALIEYFVFGILVGRARGMYGVPAPATTGNEVFERYFRAHQNTLEQLALFLPSLWMFGHAVSEIWAAGLGLIWIIGRAVYFRAYVSEPASRGAGFALTALPMLVLLIGTLIHALTQLAGTGN